MTVRGLEDEDGFTLVEVLVAFVIMAGAVVLSFQVFGDGLRGLTAAQTRVKAVDIARSEIARHSISGAIAAGVRSGTTEGMDWRIDITPVNEAPPNGATSVRPFKVEFRIAGKDGRLEETPILETIILGAPPLP